MKRTIATIAAFAALGTGYLGIKTNYENIPDIAGIFNQVVFQKQEYEETLLKELGKTKDENTAQEIVETGYGAIKRINAGKEPAEKFANNPYDLRVLVEHTEGGDKAYLLNAETGQKLPICENSQVGDLSHRLKGLEKSAEKVVTDVFDEAKKTTLDSVEKIIKRLEEK